MIEPRLVLIAGANGAGKSTLAARYVPDLIANGSFLNADEVARELQPVDAEAARIAAGRVVVRRRNEFLSMRQSFGIETTLASKTLLELVRRANKAGYLSRLIFLFTPSPEINEFRVKQRVMLGGHNIDTDTIRRRHAQGLRLLPEYIETCHEVIILDARTSSPHEILRKEGGKVGIADLGGADLVRESVRVVEGKPSF